jgi:TonB-linked SusC/RagA family outer membrane protein
MKKFRDYCERYLTGFLSIKTIRVMKLTVILFMLTVFQLFATDAYSQLTRLNLDLKEVKIVDALKDIEDQSEFYFLYSPKLIDVERKVSINAKDETIKDILTDIFSDNVLFTVYDRQIILTPREQSELLLALQQQSVTGTVKDKNGVPIPGVIVMVTGTNKGVSTNVDGNFSIEVPPGSTSLTFSFIGMKPQVVPLDGKTTLTVTMEEDLVNIDEVVVTALGIKRSEKALGYSVQTVSGESLQKVIGTELATSLTGKVAGLLVKNSTDFGAASELTIRGEEPLLVIDGVAYANKTLSDIASEDIESISVLKGATASALYGYRGASGALIITTKNGSTNNAGITLDFSSNTMFTAGFLAIPKKQGVYGRGSNNTYDKYSDESWGTVMDGTIRNQWDPFLMDYRDYPYLPVGKNNFHNFLEQGYVTNNNVNISYKGDIVSLRSSFNWTQNKGQYPNSMLDKYSYTLAGDINTPKFKLSSNLSYSQKHSPNLGSNGYTSYDPMYSLLIWSGSDYNILDYKNNYWLKKNEVQNFTYRWGSNNPYFDRYERTNEVSRNIFNADITMSYQITDWLKASVRSGLDFYIDRGDQRVSWGSYTSTGNTPIPGNPYTWNGAWTGAYNTGQTQGVSMNNDLLFTGEKNFDKINVEYLAGGTIFFKDDYNIYANTVGGISVPDFFSLKASVEPVNVSQSTYRQQVNSLFGRIALSWNKMIYLEATGRNDWSSTLPSTTRSYFYPSVSASFVISQLMPDTKNWLDLLKVRSSWTMSKTPPAIYDVVSSYTINTAIWGNLNGVTSPSSLYGKGLLPESSNTFEVGLQGIMYKNRLMVDLSYYDKKMYDFLESAPLSPATGYTGNYINTDEVISRRGWEVSINGTPVKSEDWQLDLGFNWSTYKRVYTRLDATYSDVKPWIKVGNRVDALASYDYLRDPSGNLIFDNGRLQYSQYQSNFGWTDPDWIWGLNTTVKYKNFSLFMSVDGVVGGLMNTRTESYMWQAGVHPASVTEARAKDVANPGTSNYIGKGVKVVSGSVTYDSFGNITSDTRQYATNDIASTYKQYIIDLHNSSAWGGNGSRADTYSKTFVKLREISLTYTIPEKYLKGKAKAASVSFVGQNVFLKAKDFKYSDPDGGVEDFADPSVRYLGCNIKLTF